MRVSLCATSGCYGCARCFLAPAETRPRTATIGIATALWQHRWASRGISPGSRRCHDGGKPGGPSALVSKQTTSATRGRSSQKHVYPVTGPDPPMYEVDACLL